MPKLQRFPDWDPRSWSEPYRDPPTVPRRPAVPGQWIELPDGRWDWDTSAPDADDSPTWIGPSPAAAQHELGTARKEPAMTQLEPEPQPTTPPGYDPYASFGTTEDEADAVDDDVALPQSMAGLDGTQLAICPTCGTGVAASRLRQQD